MSATTKAQRLHDAYVIACDEANQIAHALIEAQRRHGNQSVEAMRLRCRLTEARTAKDSLLTSFSDARLDELATQHRKTSRTRKETTVQRHARLAREAIGF